MLINAPLASFYRDELMYYKGRLHAQARKEEDVVNQLLLAEKPDRALLLLKKMRFQDQIHQDAEKALNSLLNQASTQTGLEEVRSQAGQTLQRNSEHMKKLQLFLSLENVENIVHETYDANKKSSEIEQLLLLANVEERELLEQAANNDLKKLSITLGVASSDSIKEDVESEKAIAHKPDLVEDPQAPAKESELKDLDAAESVASADADDEKSTVSGNPSEESKDVSSVMLPNVPSHSLSDEKQAAIPIAENN